MKRSKSTSPTGWWLVGLLQKQSDPKQAPYWNNHWLVKAKHWRTAFKRGTQLGRQDAQPTKAFRYQQKFIGITNLVPIYDPFEHGGEIIWEELWPEKGQRTPLKVYTEKQLKRIYEKPNKQKQAIGEKARLSLI